MRVTLKLLDGITSEEGLRKVHDLTDRPFVIGRSPDAHWTLLDPSNRVSGAHVEIRRQGEDVVLVDLSSGGTGLNSAANRLVKDQPVKLPDDCTLVLPVGAISVSVERAEQGPLGHVQEKDDFFSLGEVRRERSRRKPDVPRANPAALLGEDEPSNPLRMPVASAPEGSGSMAPSRSADMSSAGASQLLNPVDLLGGGPVASTPRPTPEPVSREPQRSNPFGTDVPDTLTDVGPRPEVTSRASVPTEPARPAAAASRGGSSWLEDDDEDDSDPFGGAAVKVQSDEPQPEVMPTPVAEQSPVTGAQRPEPLAVTTPMPNPNLLSEPPVAPQTNPVQNVEQPPVGDDTTPPAQPAPTGPSAGSDALNALLTQLGVSTDITDAEKAALVAEIGRTYAAMADAMRQMLATRAEVKRALGIVATEVEIGANPLKTARDKTAAIDGLIRPLSSGFLSGEAAVEDSLHSMQAHQYAMVSGIKAALQKTLDAFNPDTLEEKMTRRGLASWLPGQRKAALWDSFVTNYDMFSEQAAENFRMLIGRELDSLYQTRRDQPPGWPDDRK